MSMANKRLSRVPAGRLGGSQPPGVVDEPSGSVRES